MSIEVKNLLKIYGEQKAVNDISFHINKGEIVGFLGPNGAGKSTTMKIITGSLQATEGEARVCGVNVQDEPISVKEKIGYLPEQNALYPDMYIKEYLSFIGAIHHIADSKKKIDEVIELTGLTAERKKKIGQLSKGYKQRVGLAAALLHDPEVLILDEPTSGLDPNQIIEIRDVIKKQGVQKTVLFSSHILQEVEAMCDRVIIINKGVLVADDKLSKLQNQSSAQQTIKVKFSEPVHAALFEQLSDVVAINSDADILFQLQCHDADKVKKQLLQLALEHNLNIVSLQSDTQSLENIFKSLTN